jgi:hypothetical protein
MLWAIFSIQSSGKAGLLPEWPLVAAGHQPNPVSGVIV